MRRKLTHKTTGWTARSEIVCFGMEAVAITKNQGKTRDHGNDNATTILNRLTRSYKISNEVMKGRLGVTKGSRRIRETQIRWADHMYRRGEDHAWKELRKE